MRSGSKKIAVSGTARWMVLVVLAVGGGWMLGRGARHSAPPAENLAAALESTTHGLAPAAASGPAGPVAVAEVAAEEQSTPVAVTGTVQATMKADVSAKIMSKVAAVLVREGQRVGAGQAVVRLESADLAASIAQARAAVRSAEEAIKQARTGSQIQVTQSSTRVEQAKSALEAAKQQLSMVTEGPRKQQKLQANAAVEEAEAAVAQAKANLSLVREGSRRQQKLQAQQAVLQAQAQYNTARTTHDRFKTLVDQDVIPRQRYDEVKAQYDSAAAQLEMAKQQASLVDEGARPQEVLAAEEAVRQAEARVRSAKQQAELAHEGGREQEIAAARAQVQQAEQGLRMAQAATAENAIKRDNVSLLMAQRDQAAAALRAAEVQASYAVVTSPFSGVVTARRVDPGDMAAPGIPLLTIEDANAFRLEVTVPEARVAGIQVGMPIPVSLDSLNWKGTGKVVEVVPSADPGSRTFIAKIGLQPIRRLMSGVFGKAMLPGDSTGRLTVPASAVVRRGQLESVLVVDEAGVARLRLVRTGETANERTEIVSGVQAGERVVTTGAATILDGTKVRVE